MDERLRELRRRLGGLRRSGRRRRREYPAELRVEVVSYSTARQEQGVSLARLAADLGLPYSTLCLWMKQERSVRPFRQVVVGRSETESVPQEPGRDTATLTVVTPSGYRVEGLGVNELLALLRALA